MKLPLPLLVLSILLTAEAAASGDAVLDTDGNPLKRGTEYYIIQSPGNKGGLSLGSRNGSCPLDVVKSSDDDTVLPVRFYPADEAEDTVKLERDSNFQFTAFTTCLMSTLWQIRSSDEASEFRLYVSTGGERGNPGRQTLDNWFRILKTEDGSNGYKINFCPSVCDICRPFCGDVALFEEDGREWLRVGVGSPLSVVFKKVRRAPRALAGYF